MLELKSKLWMNGNLEWFTYIGEEEVFLGKREVPIPLEEGNIWMNELGDKFQIVEGEIKMLGRFDPPKKCW